ncbi:Mediator of RNA polymerase II transcription subunit 21 [Cichlidogyrus casuarinus]|uniref:Mediator of RNA polymerase II transcription subunit 21 n=1 Tax=Cichlidogyrus casuarinus TaxID=1844966 RepID=A0ABD2Q1Y2_9PLAT
MADRLTELQDAINIQAEYFCNSIGVLQNIAQPSFFDDFNWPARAAKPEYQEVLAQSSNSQDYSHDFAVQLTNTAKQIDILISSLPDQDPSSSDQNYANSSESYRLKGFTLVQLIKDKLERRLFRILLALNCHYKLWTIMLTDEERTRLSESFSVWSYYLAKSLFILLFLRLFSHVLPRLLSTIRRHLSPSVRARNAKIATLRVELKKLNEELEQFNMVDQFAKHAKVKRKITAVERELGQQMTDQNFSAMTSSFVFNVINYIIPAISMCILIGYSPSQSPFAQEEFPIWLSEDIGVSAFFVSLTFILAYIPTRLLMILWLALCKFSISQFLAIFQRRSKLTKSTIFSDPMASMAFREEELD